MEHAGGASRLPDTKELNPAYAHGDWQKCLRNFLA